MYIQTGVLIRGGRIRRYHGRYSHRMIAVAVCCAPCSGLLFASRAVGSNMGRRVGALENCLVMAAKSLVRAWQRGARAEAGGCDLADRIRFAIAAWFDTTRRPPVAGRRASAAPIPTRGRHACCIHERSDPPRRRRLDDVDLGCRAVRSAVPAVGRRNVSEYFQCYKTILPFF